jgi:GAF domain-containing protein
VTSEELTFPDTPRSELERAIEDLVASAQRVLSTQGRLRSLLHANRVVVEGLELPETLRRIAQAAVELVGARYGALGVIGADGGLEQFIHVGLTDEDAAVIGHLPEGHGLLGAVIESGEAIRLEHLHDDPRSAGFPAHHPGMDAFLGVPIRVRDEVFGNLYLTNPASGAFTREDEELVSVLAATAGIAIENGRLFAEARRRERWSAASARVTAEILSSESDALPLIADEVAQLVEADLVCIVEPTGADAGLRIAVARGDHADRARESVFPLGGIVGQALESNEPALVDGLDEPWLPEHGPTLVVPLSGGGRMIGALTVTRREGSRRFSPADLELASEFAAQASLAVEIARARADRSRLELSEDRARIARDLHDHVIQRLFAAGLSLQGTAMRSPELRDGILEQVDGIDQAIAEIRTVIFALSATGLNRGQSLRHRLLDVVSELDATLEASSTCSCRPSWPRTSSRSCGSPSRTSPGTPGPRAARSRSRSRPTSCASASMTTGSASRRVRARAARRISRCGRASAVAHTRSMRGQRAARA